MHAGRQKQAHELIGLLLAAGLRDDLLVVIGRAIGADRRAGQP